MQVTRKPSGNHQQSNRETGYSKVRDRGRRLPLVRRKRDPDVRPTPSRDPTRDHPDHKENGTECEMGFKQTKGLLSI